MKMNDVYNELAIDLVSECGLNMFAARKVVDFLKQGQYIDYDALKESYAGYEADES
jgi:hypothetical protein